MTTLRRLFSLALNPRSQVTIWALMCACGFGALWMHSASPGASKSAAATWPANSSLAREAGRPTLLIFIHPRCPCTRASLHELSSLARRLEERPRLVVVAATPKSARSDAAWTQSEVMKQARAIAGSDVFVDVGGTETGIFGALTSGETRLYGGDGRLLFQGGLTASRGHIGPSAGAETIRALLEGEKSNRVASSIFGCALVRGDRRPADSSR